MRVTFGRFASITQWAVFASLLLTGVVSLHRVPTKSSWLSVAGDGSFAAGLEAPALPWSQPRVRIYESDLTGSKSFSVGGMAWDQTSLSFSRSGDRVALLTSTESGAVVREFGIDGQPASQNRLDGIAVIAIAYIEEDQVIACMQRDGDLNILRLDPAKSRYQVAVRQARKVLFDAERRLSWITTNGKVSLNYDRPGQTPLRSPPLEDWNSSLAWDATQKHVATIGHLQQLRIRSMDGTEDSSLPFTLSGPSGMRGISPDTCPLAFSGDGTLVGCLSGKRAHVVDVKTGTVVASLSLPAGHVGKQVAFQGRDHLLISTSVGPRKNDRVTRWNFADSTSMTRELGMFTERSKEIACLASISLLFLWVVWFVRSGIRRAQNSWRPFLDLSLILSTIWILLTAGIVSMSRDSLPFDVQWELDFLGWASLATKLLVVSSVAVWFVTSQRRLGVRLVVVSLVASVCLAMTLACTNGRDTLPIYLLGPFTMQALITWAGRAFGWRIESESMKNASNQFRSRFHVRDLLLLTIGASHCLLMIRSQSLPVGDFTFVVIPLILSAAMTSLATVTACGVLARRHWMARVMLTFVFSAATIAVAESFLRSQFFSLQQYAVLGTLSCAFVLTLVVSGILRLYGYRLQRRSDVTQPIPT